MNIQFLNECFICDFLNGVLVWKNRPLSHFKDIRSQKIWNARFANKQAGSKRKDGYCRVGINSKDQLVHRIVYMMHTNELLNMELDHIDGNPSNNSIQNLRKVTHSQNLSNQKRNSKNTSGTTGVYFNVRKKWCAQMKHNQKTWHLGSFEKIEDAIAARKAEEKRLGFHLNHGRN